MTTFYSIGLALACLALVNAIPIDNGILGEPEVDCGAESIRITFNTQNPFSGHTYVRGEFDKETEGCRATGDGARSVATIELPFQGEGGTDCNIKRERSLEPKGVFVRTDVVISFHPNFLTKIDRAYTIQCFYMEADKTVSTDIEVSAITTGFATQFVPMPICRYEILDAPDGNPVEFAIIGMPVFHKWTCDSDTVDTFCMNVHSCYVVDPAGENRLDLLGEDGCAMDKFVLGNVDYVNDLMAVKEVHVFKYADKPALFFQCQVTILVKEPNADCIRPVCADPPGLGGSGNRKRRAVVESETSVGTMDLAMQLETLDISTRPTHLPNRSTPTLFDRPIYAEQSADFCLSPTGVWSFSIIMMVFFVLCVAVVMVCSKKSQK